MQVAVVVRLSHDLSARMRPFQWADTKTTSELATQLAENFFAQAVAARAENPDKPFHIKHIKDKDAELARVMLFYTDEPSYDKLRNWAHEADVGKADITRALIEEGLTARIARAAQTPALS